VKDIVERLLTENTMYSYYDSPEIQLDAAREITRLRARVEVLERIRAAADDLFAYDSGWSHWEQKYRALRAALKEAKP
jgi:hypothetical protein